MTRAARAKKCANMTKNLKKYNVFCFFAWALSGSNLAKGILSIFATRLLRAQEGPMVISKKAIKLMVFDPFLAQDARSMDATCRAARAKKWATIMENGRTYVVFRRFA